jgi:predicted AAA+ superfamily ATPase
MQSLGALYWLLDPFVKLQQYTAMQTARQFVIANAARDVGVSAKTVQRYVQYLSLSYQVLVLPSWGKNYEKRLVKTPKIHMLDHGVLQAVLQRQGGLSGEEFESLVVAELYKQARQLELTARFYYLRTLDGREVDVLIELTQGYIAFEIKLSEHVAPADARHLRGLAEFLDKPLLHSFVLSLDTDTKVLGEGITAVHAAYFLG